METNYQLDSVHFADITPCAFILGEYEPLKHVAPTVHSYFLLYIIVKGKAIFKTATSQYTLKANQAILVFPKESVTFTALESEPISMLTIGFYGSRVNDFINQRFAKEIVFEYPQNTIKEMCIETNGSGNSFLALSIIYQAISIIHNAPNAKNTYVSDAIEYINDHLCDAVQIKEISESLGISRVCLYKAFDEIIGVSPKEYIINRKMQIAYEMLKKKESSIFDVAQAVGYKDQFAFSKLFKSKFNMSPRSLVMGKIPYVSVIDEEKGEYIWPTEITSERIKRGDHSLVAKPYHNSENDIIEGWIVRAGYYGSTLLPRNLDISTVTDFGKKGALSFWIFVENKCDITNWCINNQDWIRFGSSPDWDTDFQYWLGWHELIKNEGWNRIFLPFGDSAYGHVIGNPDYKNFCSFGMMLSVPKHIRVFIDDLKVVADY